MVRFLLVSLLNHRHRGALEKTHPSSVWVAVLIPRTTWNHTLPCAEAPAFRVTLTMATLACRCTRLGTWIPACDKPPNPRTAARVRQSALRQSARKSSQVVSETKRGWHGGLFCIFEPHSSELFVACLSAEEEFSTVSLFAGTTCLLQELLESAFEGASFALLPKGGEGRKGSGKALKNWRGGVGGEP